MRKEGNLRIYNAVKAADFSDGRVGLGDYVSLSLSQVTSVRESAMRFGSPGLPSII